jgi:F-type H+-transporting ATPase subunit b
MQIINNIALISINETLIAQLISFLIFLYIINRVMIQPLRNVARERELHIQKIQTDASEAEEEIERLVEQIRKEETAALSAANTIRGRIEDAGKTAADEIVHAAHRQVEKLFKENRRHVATLVAEARESVQKEAETLADGMLEKLLDRRLRS